MAARREFPIGPALALVSAMEASRTQGADRSGQFPDRRAPCLACPASDVPWPRQASARFGSSRLDKRLAAADLGQAQGRLHALEGLGEIQGAHVELEFALGGKTAIR